MKAVIAEVQGRAALMQRDDIDTDAIFPGRFLRLVQRTGMGAHLFADWLAEGRPEVAFMGRSTPPRMLVAGLIALIAVGRYRVSGCKTPSTST